MLQLDTRVCDKCGLVQEQDGRYCRNCGNSLPSWGHSGAIPLARSFPFDLFPSLDEIRWGKAGAVIVGLVIIAFAWWFIDAAVNAAQQTQTAAQQHQAELDREAAAAAQAAAEVQEKRLNAVVSGLQAKFPLAWFGRCPGDTGYVVVNKIMTACQVRSLTFSHSADKDLSVNVGLLGIRRES
jgi:hypothetical protein